jgi:phosphatidate cytidylyltransferase
MKDIVKSRIFFGTLMTLFFVAIVLLDGWLDGSLDASIPNSRVQGTILCLLVVFLVVVGGQELSRLLPIVGVRSFSPVTIICSLLFATSWYWPQLVPIRLELYLVLVGAGSVMAFLLYQAAFYGTAGVIANCGANCFLVFYMGILSSLVLAVRIEFGVWRLLMFILVVKSADIGAYTAGSLFGRHKFSPQISPGKTWEGMAGAVVFAVLVASIFSVGCGIIKIWPAILFGLIFAFLGQLGDLAESMIKRDAEQKDSGQKVPGFGGVLDIVDSPLMTAPFAYLFFTIAALL